MINAITERDLRNIDDASIVYLDEDGTKIEVPCLTIGMLGELYKVMLICLIEKASQKGRLSVVAIRRQFTTTKA